MEIPPDIIQKIALELSFGDVKAMCLANKEFKKIIGDSKIFWRNKIKVDFPRQKYSKDYFFENPKSLYLHLTLNSRIIQLNTKDIDKYDEENIKILTRFIIENNVRRGDVLHFGENTYRNEGKIIWDGEKVVHLDFIDDEYGSVPKEFSFPEFRPDYFSESIVHNNIVRLTPEKIKEAIDNFDIKTQTSFITDKYNKYNIKINTDISELNIKFSKMILNRDYLEYDPDNNLFILAEGILNLETTRSNGSRTTKRIHIQEITFIPEWRDAIISIDSKTPSTTYHWEGDILKVITF